MAPLYASGAGDAMLAGTNSGYPWQTGARRYKHVFDSSGTVQVAFGVTDVGDYSASTVLQVAMFCGA